MPLIARLGLGAGVVALVGAVIYVGVGGLPILASTIGDTVGGFVSSITATPEPEATPVVINDAPSIASPEEPYTNQESIDLVVSVPLHLAGDPDHVVRVYLALEGQARAPIQEAALAPTPTTIIPVLLTPGINDLSVTLVGPNGESEASPTVRYVLDTSEPAIRLSAPKNGATVNRATVVLEGRTQARSTLTARNRTTGDSIGTSAETDGTFTMTLPLDLGTNEIRINATDPAGNTNRLDIVIERGSGKLRASLSLSLYRIDAANLPFDLRMTANVDDPDGAPLADALVTFTISVPGIPAVTGEATTDANGRAIFETTIPAGADPGGGNAAILVRTDEFGRTTDQTVLTIE